MSAPATVVAPVLAARLRVLGLRRTRRRRSAARRPRTRRFDSDRSCTTARPTNALVMPRSGANVSGARRVGHDFAGVAADEHPLAVWRSSWITYSTYSSVAGDRSVKYAAFAFDREPARRHGGVAAVHPHRRDRRVRPSTGAERSGAGRSMFGRWLKPSKNDSEYSKRAPDWPSGRRPASRREARRRRRQSERRRSAADDRPALVQQRHAARREHAAPRPRRACRRRAARRRDAGDGEKFGVDDVQEVARREAIGRV